MIKSEAVTAIVSGGDDNISNDLTKFVQDARERFPGKSVFVLSESAGAMIAFHRILREQKTKTAADGYIMTGPIISLRQDMLPPRFVVKIVKILVRFFAELKMPGIDLYTTFDEAFGDPCWAKAGRADPFIQEAFVTPPLLDMTVSFLTVSESNKKSMDQVKVPVFIWSVPAMFALTFPKAKCSSSLPSRRTSNWKSLTMVATNSFKTNKKQQKRWSKTWKIGSWRDQHRCRKLKL